MGEIFKKKQEVRSKRLGLNSFFIGGEIEHR